MRRFCFILNPAARKGKGGRLYDFLKEKIEQHRLDAEIRITEGPGHATKIALASDASVQVAVGGDGTINEVANAIVATEKVLGVIPNGSGNDFVKSIGIPTDARRAFECILEGSTVAVDTATVRCLTEAGGNSPQRYFVNGVGIGFDAAVADRTRSIAYLGGFALYLVAVLQTLGRYRAPLFRVRTEREEIAGRKLLIAVGNGQCAGGGFYLTPSARVDDGVLDLCLIEDMSVPRILNLMPKVMKGRHAGVGGVYMTTARELHVEAPEPFYVHADGEIVGRAVHRVDVVIHQGSLRVISGERFRNAR